MGPFSVNFQTWRRMKVVSRTLLKKWPEHLPRTKAKKIALLIPYKFKNKLRTIQPQIFEKNKNNQPELKFTDSYKKECK